MQMIMQNRLPISDMTLSKPGHTIAIAVITAMMPILDTTWSNLRTSLDRTGLPSSPISEPRIRSSVSTMWKMGWAFRGSFVIGMMAMQMVSKSEMTRDNPGSRGCWT